MSWWSCRLNRALRSAVAGLVLVLCSPAVLGMGQAPKADLWERWTTHDPDSGAVIDHQAWDRFVREYVTTTPTGVNRVAYARVEPEDRQALRDYIDRLAGVPISEHNRDQQLAYWINLYNALTVDLILEHYPVDSILDIDISPGLVSFGPWDKKLVTVEGEELSLNDIEHRILRPIWEDPRIHYGLNCAATGCPNLRRQAFDAANAEALLAQGAREYVNDERGAVVEGGRLMVSSIYVWFQEDFGGTDRGVIEHLREYAEPALDARLAGVSKIHNHRYDWSLNGVDTEFALPNTNPAPISLPFPPSSAD